MSKFFLFQTHTKESWTKEDPSGKTNCYQLDLSAWDKLRLFVGICPNKKLQNFVDKGKKQISKEFNIIRILLKIR